MDVREDSGRLSSMRGAGVRTSLKSWGGAIDKKGVEEIHRGPFFEAF